MRAWAMSCSSFQTRRSSFMSSTSSSGRLTMSAARPASLLDTHKHTHTHTHRDTNTCKYLSIILEHLTIYITTCPQVLCFLTSRPHHPPAIPSASSHAENSCLLLCFRGLLRLLSSVTLLRFLGALATAGFARACCCKREYARGRARARAIPMTSDTRTHDGQPVRC